MAATRDFVCGLMRVLVFGDRRAMGAAAALQVGGALMDEVASSGEVSAIFACAPSQSDFLSALREMPDIPWDRVTVFHMDEYLGMPESNPESFRNFLRRELVSRVKPREFHGIRGEAADPAAELRRYAGLVESARPAVCVLGIGENGHLAFNDPPADFETKETIHLVTLDEKCRMQQVGEGHFPSLAEAPSRAYSLTVPALLRPRQVVGVVPGPKKAVPVRDALEGPITPDCPASILRTRSNVTLYLDMDAAGLLTR